MFGLLARRLKCARYFLLRRAAIEALEGRAYLSLSVSTGVSYTTAHGPLAVTIADVNGDGKKDIITASGVDTSSSGQVSVLLGNGTGKFAAKTDYSTIGPFPKSIASGDFNGDGRADIATGNFDSTVSVLLSTGNALGAAHTFVDGGSGNNIEVADVNGDSKLDIITAGGSGVSALLGNGDGTFATAIVTTTGGSVSGIAVAELTGDGKVDFAVSDFDNDVVGIWTGHNDGTFTHLRDLAAGTEPHDVLAIDLNHDGKMDLVDEASTNSSATTCQLYPFFSGGDGTFTAQVPYVIDPDSGSIDSGDFNGDGKLDLLARGGTPNSGVPRGTILEVGTDGTIAPASFMIYGDITVQDVAGSRNPTLAVSDLNGDGFEDLVGTQQTLSGVDKVTVFLMFNGAAGGGGGGSTTSSITPTVTVVKPRALLAGAKISPALQLKVALTNTSSAKSGPVRVSVVASNDPSGSGGVPVKTTTFRGKILAHKSATVPITLTSIPPGVTGTVYLVATTTDSAGNTSVAASGALTVAPPTNNFSGSALTIPAKSRAGKSIALSLGVTQLGNVKFNGQLGAEIYLSSTQSLSGAIDTGFAIGRVSMLAGKKETLRIKRTLPAGLTGTFYILANIDQGGAYHDTDTSNNLLISNRQLVIS